MKKHTLFLFFVLISTFNSTVWAKPDKTVNGIVQNVQAVETQPTVQPTTSQPQPTEAAPQPTSVPSTAPTTAPQPTEAPAQPTQVVQVQPTTPPQPTSIPVNHGETYEITPTRTPIIGGPVVDNTTKSNKPSSSTTSTELNDTNHPYQAAIQPTAAPIEPASQPQSAPAEAVQTVVEKAVSTAQKVLPLPIFNIFKSHNNQTYYKDARISADESTTLLSIAFMLFISGIFFINTSLHRYVFHKFTYLRTILF